jgi:hypothetical protein
MNTKETNIKVKECTIFVSVGNGELIQYHKNNKYKNYTEEQIVKMFGLESLYFSTDLEGANLAHTFNTYNWSAPFTFCGVYSGEVYDDTPGLVNIHLGGDARGNYSKPYICNDMEAIMLQSSFVEFELSNGETITIDSENSEAYFDLILDPYYIDFERNLTANEYEELKENNNN